MLKLRINIPLVLYYLLKSLIAAGFLLSLVRQEWQTSFMIALILLLTFTPTLLRKRYKIYLPLAFDLFVIVFIFLSLFLGEIYQYYHRFWWWDLYLHANSSILSGILGFMLIYFLNAQKKVGLRMNTFFVALFAFTFAISIGVLWEVFEFCMDTFFGLNMQKSGLLDTMTDLILNTSGAFIASFVGYLWMKKKAFSFFFDAAVKQFVKKNKHLLG
ncbi:MAG: hypothetical protein PHU71_01090 [Candidatus Gracilibacteria bacterium]|nr:hypothetical protein [Candidatus Gracilibacteria bacterium]